MNRSKPYADVLRDCAHMRVAGHALACRAQGCRTLHEFAGNMQEAIERLLSLLSEKRPHEAESFAAGLSAQLGTPLLLDPLLARSLRLRAEREDASWSFVRAIGARGSILAELRYDDILGPLSRSVLAPKDVLDREVAHTLQAIAMRSAVNGPAAARRVRTWLEAQSRQASLPWKDPAAALCQAFDASMAGAQDRSESPVDASRPRRRDTLRA
jgi:hypothetical protein